MAKNKSKKNKIRGNTTQADSEASSQALAHARRPSNTATSYSSTTAASTSKLPQLDGCSTPLTQLSKRDSVVSSTWEDSKRNPEPKLEPVRRNRWRRILCGLWPCRFVRWVHAVIAAFARASQGPQRRDLFLTFCLAAICIFVSYTTVELICRMIQTVAAQDTGFDWTVDFVTISDPISTVSLIDATPSDLDHGSYSFSMVDGTTQWLNSIAPPSPTNAQNIPSIPTSTLSKGPPMTQHDDVTTASSKIADVPSSYPSAVVLPSMLWSTSIPITNSSARPSSLLLSDDSYSVPPNVIASRSSISNSTSATTALSSMPWRFTETDANTSKFKTLNYSATTVGASVIGSTVFIVQTNSAGMRPQTSSISNSGGFATSTRSILLSAISSRIQLKTSISKTLKVSTTNKAFLTGTKRPFNINTRSSTTSASSLVVGDSRSLNRRLILITTTASVMATMAPVLLTRTTPRPLSPSLTHSVPSHPIGTPLNPQSVASTWSRKVDVSLSSSVPGSTPSESLFSTPIGTSTIQHKITPMPFSNSTVENRLEIRDLASKITQILAYGNIAIRFIFPPRDIITTVSYWTGVYPTVTGPMPTALASFLSVTRSVRQTPLSVAPSFELSPSGSSFAATATGGAAPTATSIDGLGPEPPICGEAGNFTLNFDDTVISVNRNQVVSVNMKAPYHHFFYGNGLITVPDKWEPYPAISQPNIAMFLPPLLGGISSNTPFAGTLLPGELGAGPRASVNAYWFNAYSGYFGCALNGLVACTLRISGYRYDAVLKQEVLVVEQNATIPPCYLYINCRLRQVFFNDQFRALSGIQFNAYTPTLGIPQIHMMDDVHLGWYNNSCSAGILRLGHS